MTASINDYVFTDAQLIDFIQIELDLIQGFVTEEKVQNIPPFIKVLDSTKQLHIIPLDHTKDLNKSAQRRQDLVEIGTKFYKQWGSDPFPAVVMLTSEAWLKSFDAKAMPKNFRQPSDYPDAIDSIVTQAITLGKPSILDTSRKPRACMAALKINRRKPYILVEVLTEPNLYKAGPDTTDLLNHFFIGWFQEYAIDHNN